jgi:lipoyl(octanoyl) transferase
MPRVDIAMPSPDVLPSSPHTPAEWRVTPGLTGYPEAVAAMEARVAAIAGHSAPEEVWLVEHPPLYTAGTTADPEDLLAPDRFPVHRTGRGGQYTYHGPGQRIAYVMLDLGRRGPDLRRFVRDLEEWIIRTVGRYGVAGERREGLVGVWVKTPLGHDKIAAIGIRVRRWVSFHGIALNVDPDLGHFSGIVPCGVRGAGVTSLRQLGIDAAMPEVDALLREEFEALFGPTVTQSEER